MADIFYNLTIVVGDNKSKGEFALTFDVNQRQLISMLDVFTYSIAAKHYIRSITITPHND